MMRWNGFISLLAKGAAVSEYLEMRKPARANVLEIRDQLQTADQTATAQTGPQAARADLDSKRGLKPQGPTWIAQTKHTQQHP